MSHRLKIWQKGQSPVKPEASQSPYKLTGPGSPAFFLHCTGSPLDPRGTLGLGQGKCVNVRFTKLTWA